MSATLKDVGEFGLIERIAAGCRIRPQGVVRGIGDDAAAVTPAGGLLLLATDLMTEGIHFLRDTTSAADLGYKALAANLSDIAAMGGTAREALVSIAVPDDCTVDFIEDLYRGMLSLAAEHRVNIIGGDTTAARSDLVVSITVSGHVAEEHLLRRDRAQVGDIICLTGYPGESRAGLHLLLNRIGAFGPAFGHLRRRHWRPRPHLAEGHWLGRHDEVHAAIDISDGLGADLGHVTNQSGVGARIDTAALPVSPSLRMFCRRFGIDPVDTMLSGGEDYILLCTVAAGAAAALCADFEETFKRPLYRIGEITGSGSVERMDPDGRSTGVSARGWNHFRKEASDGA